jgi:hypothetical protein
MISTYVLGQKKRIDELVASGRRDDAAALCLALAEYFDGEESNCDAAGEFADGMRASRQAQALRDRARELSADTTEKR